MNSSRETVTKQDGLTRVRINAKGADDKWFSSKVKIHHSVDEVSTEDFALCEFVCTSKIEVQKIIRHGSIDDMNLDQLYARMKTIKERNEKIIEAKKLLDVSGESNSEHKTSQQKKLPSPQRKGDLDSTS